MSRKKITIEETEDSENYGFHITGIWSIQDIDEVMLLFVKIMSDLKNEIKADP